MPEDSLLVLLPVRPGCEEQLFELLNQAGNDVRGRRQREAGQMPLLNVSSSTTIHFLRLTMLDDPDRGPECKRLLVATDFDGEPRPHIEELHLLFPQPEQIWGCCLGYRGAEHFEALMESARIHPHACYIAFPNRTVGDFRTRLETRDRFNSWLSRQDSRGVREEAPPEPPRGSSESDAVSSLAGAIATTIFTGTDVLLAAARLGPMQVLSAAREINLTLGRVGWIRIFNLLTLNFESEPAPLPSSLRSAGDVACTEGADPNDEIVRPQVVGVHGPPPEDVVAQNQLTLVTVVKPEMLPWLRAVLELIDIYATRLASPGDLIGIGTIHTVRWALLDDGKRLLMVSSYDGTWEHYIDEFAEMILSGLDAIWGKCFGMPPAGARDLPAFKRFLRCHQAPASVFYSAYPTATVLALRDME